MSQSHPVYTVRCRTHGPPCVHTFNGHPPPAGVNDHNELTRLEGWQFAHGRDDSGWWFDHAPEGWERRAGTWYPPVEAIDG